ncbi:hypothetical protein LJY25_14945 [Hymenobacter sp. BT175]|uniref:hypothetical protein n=1 Tax=Hymenobacter translucens TaxID=2886507 RepID=UPI001D0DE156|nr:hypothetical protein [Hymenobacter translucens]MCC2547747.1 hypothetical protein [Hymenobacter translucens]
MVLLAGSLPRVAPAQRQGPAGFPPPTPAPTEDPALHRGSRGLSGSFQSTDNTWHPGQIQGWTRDRVYLTDAGARTYRAYFPAQVKRFVVAPGDTFNVVRDVVVTSGTMFRRRQIVPEAFAQQLFRGAGYTLLSYQRNDGPDNLLSWTTRRLLLRQPDGTVLVLPANGRKCRQLLLTLLRDDAALAGTPPTSRFRPWRDARQLLAAYTDRKINLALRPTGGGQ